jgi:hypothetical protein
MNDMVEILAIITGVGGLLATAFGFASNQGKQIAKLDRLECDLTHIADLYRSLDEKLDNRLDNIDRRLSRLEGKTFADSHKPCEGWID